jgi:hypothetical protein
MGRIDKTVFISYRRRDEPWALAVFGDLTASGLRVRSTDRRKTESGVRRKPVVEAWSISILTQMIRL